MPKKILQGKIYSEGYCCLNGYLRLCQARGEAQGEMAEFIGVSYRTIKYKYQALREGRANCARQSDCMDGIITQIESEKKPSEEG